MGMVYKVEHKVLNRQFALKVILPQTELEESTLDRFRNEAQALLDLRHEHIVRIFEFGITEGNPFQILELVDGAPLSTFIGKQGDLTFDQRLMVAIQLAQALSCAHAKGILHRDVKPSNVIVKKEGLKIHATLIDFGLAKSELTPGHTLTRTGDIVGSPAYISPEQAKRNPLDARSDL